MDSQSDLLFAAVALQNELIDERQFAEVLQEWAANGGSNTGLPDILGSRGWLSDDDRRAVETIVRRRLESRDHSLDRTVAAAGKDPTVRRALARIEDEEVTNSIQALSHSGVHVETIELNADVGARAHHSITRLHSEGGLGRVYLARDERLLRDVALKEMKREAKPNDEGWTRFCREAQITGQLEHPNIVPVYHLGLGDDSQKPFYTMRFLRGQTLKEAIADYHATGGEARTRPLELARLLRAFIAICQAVGYAHSRHVVHRDLKPDNVILGSFGEVILLDWGLAKMLKEDVEDSVEVEGLPDDLELTADGRILGTPAYMAPEQASGRVNEVGTPTDIYGLGAILFSILVGRGPHTGVKSAATIQKIVTKETPQARSVKNGVPPALNAICLKAMAREPEQRYTSASELADDVERWLVHEPVSVFPDPWTIRVGRWARRHKGAVSTAVSVCIVGVIALIGTTLAIAREQQETSREQQRAEQNFQLAQSAVDRMLTRVGAHWLRDVPYMTEVRTEILEEALQFNEKLLELNADDPVTLAQTATSYRRLGLIYDTMDQSTESREAHERGLRIIEDLVRRFPGNTEYRRVQAFFLLNLGTLAYREVERERSEELVRRGVDIMQEVVLEEPRWMIDLADAEQTLGRVLNRKGDAEGAEDYFLSSLERLDTVTFDGQPSRAWLRARSLGAYNLGLLYEETGEWDLAEQLFQEAIDLRAAVLAGDDSNVDDEQAQLNNLRALAVLVSHSGRTSEAEALTLQLLEQQRALSQRFPLILEYQGNLSAILTDLGTVYMQQGRLEEAETYLAEGMVINQRALQLGPEVPFNKRLTGYDFHRLAELAILRGDLESERRHRQQELDVRTGLSEEFTDNPDYRWEAALALTKSGGLHQRIGEIATARQHLDRAVEMTADLRREFPDFMLYAGFLSMALRHRGEMHTRSGDWAAARDDFDEGMRVALQGAEEAPDSMFHRLNQAEIHTGLARLGIAQRQQDLAGLRDQAQVAIEAWAGLRERNPDNAKYLLGWAQSLLDRVDVLMATDPAVVRAELDALVHVLESTSIQLDEYAARDFIEARRRMADARSRLLLESGNVAEAILAIEDAQAAADRMEQLLAGADGEIEFQRRWVEAHLVLGDALAAAGRSDEADAAWGAAGNRLATYSARSPSLPCWSELSAMLEERSAATADGG